MQESREEYLTSSWKAWSANAAREYRCGFEDGMANKNISGMPYMSDA